MASWRKSKDQRLDLSKNHIIDSRNVSGKDGLDCRYMNPTNHTYYWLCKINFIHLLQADNRLEFEKQPRVQKSMKNIYQLEPSLPKDGFTWVVSTMFKRYRKLPANELLNIKTLTLKKKTILTLI